MKTAYTPQPSYKRSITEDAERDSHFITRTVIRLAARCAIACLSLSKRLRGPISTPVPNVQSSMATATLDHQEKCQCNSCKCELLVTWEPFTPTRSALVHIKINSANDGTTNANNLEPPRALDRRAWREILLYS